MVPQSDSNYSETFQLQVFVFVLYLVNPETQEFRQQKDVIFSILSCFENKAVDPSCEMNQ